MKLSQLQEARYYRQHPWLQDFIDNFYDPDVDPIHQVPEDISEDEFVRVMTDVFGEPKIIKNVAHEEYEWRASLEGRNNSANVYKRVTLFIRSSIKPDAPLRRKDMFVSIAKYN